MSEAPSGILPIALAGDRQTRAEMGRRLKSTAQTMNLGADIFLPPGETLAYGVGDHGVASCTAPEF